jgi:hypothetical protein
MSKSADHAAEALQAILAAISINDLINELMTREGIAAYAVKGGESYRIQKQAFDGLCYAEKDLERYHGPVTIITVSEP